MLKLFTLCFLISFITFPQGKFAYQITALFPEVHFVGIEYSNSSYISRAYLSNSKGTVSNYVFEIKFYIKLNGNNFTWNDPILLEYSSPVTPTKSVILNSEFITLDSYRLYEYSFTFKTKYSAWVNFNLAFVDSSINSSEINFSGNSIYVDVTPYKE